MTLNDFLDLVDDVQNMQLVYEGFSLNGKKEVIGYLLNEDVYKGTVFAVEAEDDVLKVFVKEDNHAS